MNAWHRRLRATPAGLAGRPRTTVGLFLRAGALEDQKSREQFSSQLNGGQPGWIDHEAAVALAACELAIRRLFAGVHDASEVDRYVSDVYARWQGEQVPVGRDELVEIVLDALGEPESALAGITPFHLFAFRWVLIAVACASMGLRARQVEDLIAEAERIAFEHGWNPPLSSLA